jgi:hypothetical protein
MQAASAGNIRKGAVERKAPEPRSPALLWLALYNMQNQTTGAPALGTIASGGASSSCNTNARLLGQLPL